MDPLSMLSSSMLRRHVQLVCLLSPLVTDSVRLAGHGSVGVKETRVGAWGLSSCLRHLACETNQLSVAVAVISRH